VGVLYHLEDSTESTKDAFGHGVTTGNGWGATAIVTERVRQP